MNKQQKNQGISIKNHNGPQKTQIAIAVSQAINEMRYHHQQVNKAAGA